MTDAHNEQEPRGEQEHEEWDPNKLGHSFQESLVTAIIYRTDDNTRDIVSRVEIGWFEDPYRELVAGAVGYWKEYDRAPEGTHVDDQFARVLEDPNHKSHKLYTRILRGMLQNSQSVNTQYLKNELWMFGERQTLRTTVYQAGTILKDETGEAEHDKARELLRKGVKKSEQFTKASVDELVISFAKMLPNLEVLSLVDDLLGPGQISVVYGEKSTGKTFLALDIAAHIAALNSWFGHRVEPGIVFYVAAEAGKSIANRILAWRIHRNLMNIGEADVPLFIWPRSLNLNGSDLNQFIAAIRDSIGDIDNQPALIVIDTVSRVMAGGNENAPEGMGIVLAAADRLRDEFGSHVMLIHHVGKDSSRGARGHSSLDAAADTMIEVTRNKETKISTATVVKQREGETGQKYHFRLHSVRIGEKNGKEVTSCAVERADDVDTMRAEDDIRERKLSGGSKIALDALRKAINAVGTIPPACDEIPAEVQCVSEDTWRDYCYNRGISTGEAPAKRQAFNRARADLMDKRKVGVWGEWVWLAEG